VELYRDLVRILSKDDSPNDREFCKQLGVLIGANPEEGLEYYICHLDAINWFIKINSHLYRQGKHLIPHSEFDILFHFCCPVEIEAEFPASIFHLGHRWGLIGHGFESSDLFFPLVRVLLLADPHGPIGVDALESLSETDFLYEDLKLAIKKSLKHGFSLHDSEVVENVKKHFNLTISPVDKTINIEGQLGLASKKNIKSELIFWEALEADPKKHLTPFFKAIFLLIISRSGSLIQWMGGEWDQEFQFLCKGLGLQVREMPRLNLSLLTDSRVRENILLSPAKSERVRFDEVIEDLKPYLEEELSFEDIVEIAKSVQKKRKDRIRSTARVYLALKELRMPSHFSEITRIHNRMFLDWQEPEGAIQSYLERQEYGIFATEEDGVFWLREFQNAVNRQSLSDEIEEIVAMIYANTNRPVSKQSILVELSRRRHTVNENSVNAYLYGSRKLKRVGTGLFIPKTEKELEEEEQRNEQINRAVNQFVASRDAEKHDQDIDQKKHYFATFRCVKCGHHESELVMEGRWLYLQCAQCKNKIKYPAGLWGINTTIPCPDCGNHIQIRFHPRYGPYFKCVKCEKWYGTQKFLG